MIFGESAMGEVGLALVSRGSKSRNKVSVGEPAEGSVLFGAACRSVNVYVATSLSHYKYEG